MVQLAERILVTGANGHLGRQLIARLCGAPGEVSAGRASVRALVRSQHAADLVREQPVESPPEVVIGEYGNLESMRGAVADCDAIVHLVGIIKEGQGASYRAAHEDPCLVLREVSAESSIRRIVYLSIFGADSHSSNDCLASRGRAEEILLGATKPITLLRVPMVLGPDDIATRSLLGQALAPLTPLIGGGSTLQQPIDSHDVVSAIVAALNHQGEEEMVFDLGGPESLTHRALVERVASLHGRKPRFLPIPYPMARILAVLLEKLSKNPPITEAMLGILQHDDRLDTAPCCHKLGLALTPLSETLRCYVGTENFFDE